MPRQTLIAQPLPLIEGLGKLIIVFIQRCVFERQPAQDGGQDEYTETDLDWGAQFDVDLVRVQGSLVWLWNVGRPLRR